MLAIDLTGKHALVAGVGDERGFGFSIAKALADAGAVPVATPLQEAITAEEVGATAAFLSSPLASGITGTVIYVDKGYAAMGVALPG